jgi:outer membrane protein assembly factor BamB
VIANGKLYINGYLGEGPDLQEAISCFDAETGKKLWEHRFGDFLSDTIYLRYATGSPSVDPETGNVYMQGVQGIFACFTADGKLLWQHSMMEEYGRMTFPNARTASPIIDKELVITRGITSNWGAHGAAGDRFYAFDKKTGELVWTSAPGSRPQDNTFSHPLLTWHEGKRVLISAGGDSNIVALNARTGDPLFRFPAAKAGAKGGINAAVMRYNDSLLVVHESENVDTSEVGRTASYKLPTNIKPEDATNPQVLEAKALEQWRNPLGTLASSPALVGDTMYIVTGTGEIASVDAKTGKILWRQKLAPEQRQSSPMYADGRLYVGMYTAAAFAGGEDAAPAPEGTHTGGNGELFVIKPTEKGPEILSRTILDGRCYGTPIPFNGKVYIQTDRKLYCFGKKGDNESVKEVLAAYEDWPEVKAGPAARLQIIPSEMLLRPKQAVQTRVRVLDANGFTVEENADLAKVKFASYVPPTALVKAEMKGEFNAKGQLVADAEPLPSAGAFQAKMGELTGTMRARVLPDIPFKNDFERFELSLSTDNPPPPATPNTVEPATAFNYPPLPWNGARFRFELRQAPAGGTKALVKTISDKRFQRSQVFIGHPDMKNYTVEADVLTEGNRRKMSEIGLINQRYLIILKGNSQQIEVTSNQERVREAAPFKVSPNTWYRLKTRVDIAKDGSGVVRAKAWPKDQPEPEAWSIEVPHKAAHQQGSPGIFSFAPQDQRAWIDNISVTAN